MVDGKIFYNWPPDRNMIYSYIFYWLGRLTIHDAAQFAKESAASRVVNLTPQYFRDQILDGKAMWFVDYFAPVSKPKSGTIL